MTEKTKELVKEDKLPLGWGLVIVATIAAIQGAIEIISGEEEE